MSKFDELDEIDPRILGQRLADARKARGITQEAGAEFLGCSRPTFIAIEKGDRRPKPDELVKLAGLYGRPVHEFVRAGATVVSLEPHLRAAVGRGARDHAELSRAIGELQRFAEDYLELERVMRSPLSTNFPPSVELNPRVDVLELAEDVAQRDRQRLGLGDQPVIYLRSILEGEVGLRIFYSDSLPAAVAGLYAFSSDLGCCILVNRKHPPERRRATLAHEYGHLFVDRYKPGIDYLSAGGRKPENERFVEAFGLSFLMPATSIRRQFHEIVTSTGDFQVADLCRLSHLYFCSVVAMALRLEQLDLIPRGSWDEIKDAGLKVRHASQTLKLPSQPEAKDPYPERYKYLAINAYQQERISEGELARFLRCDRVSARELVEACRSRTFVEEDGVQQTLQVEFQQSLFPSRT